MPRNVNQAAAPLRRAIGTAPGAQNVRRAAVVDTHPTTKGDKTTDDATPAINSTGTPITPTQKMGEEPRFVVGPGHDSGK